MKLLFKVLCDIEDLAGLTPAPGGQNEEWAAIICGGVARKYCKSLRGKTLFSALYGTYTVTLNELKAVPKSKLQTGQPKMQDDSFKEL
jgi:hypothetical protein